MSLVSPMGLNFYMDNGRGCVSLKWFDFWGQGTLVTISSGKMAFFRLLALSPDSSRGKRVFQWFFSLCVCVAGRRVFWRSIGLCVLLIAFLLEYAPLSSQDER